jgi:hypothetical protein
MGNPEFSEGDGASVVSVVEEVVTVESSIRQLVLASGATLSPEDVDKIVAKVLTHKKLAELAQTEAVEKLDAEFEAAIAGPRKWLEQEQAKLFEQFDAETTKAQQVHNEGLVKLGILESEPAIVLSEAVLA